MTETEDSKSGYDGQGLKGALWTLAGTTIGQLANQTGLLGAACSGGPRSRPTAPWPR